MSSLQVGCDGRVETESRGSVMPEEIVPPSELPDWAQFQASLTTHTIVRDEQGILRYAINPLVRWLEDHVSLNDMWIAYRRTGAWTREQFMQFYRDIGYSLNGFEEIWGEELEEMEESEDE
jgi:hypothetical protein